MSARMFVRIEDIQSGLAAIVYEDKLDKEIFDGDYRPKRYPYRGRPIKARELRGMEYTLKESHPPQSWKSRFPPELDRALTEYAKREASQCGTKAESSK